jgi:GTPase SAR1 family protein
VTDTQSATADDLEMRVVLVGPMGVGKTSLMTTLADGGVSLLGGTRVALEYDEPTAEMIRTCRAALDGSLSAEQFRINAMRPSVELTEYRYTVNPRISGADRFRFPLTVLDMPGGWFGPAGIPASMARNREIFDGFLSSASTLLVPIDATVLMEARVQRHTSALPEILRVQDVLSAVERWAKDRRTLDGSPLPATVVLVPVKCETYLHPVNGHANPAADRMRELVDQFYTAPLRELLERQQVELGRILYCPVETIGPIKLKRADWAESHGVLECRPSYEKVEGATRRRPRGGEELFAFLCADVLSRLREHWFGVAEWERMQADRPVVAPAGAGVFAKAWFYLFDVWDERNDRKAHGAEQARLLLELAQLDRAVSAIVDREKQAFVNSPDNRFAVLYQATPEWG